MSNVGIQRTFMMHSFCLDPELASGNIEQADLLGIILVSKDSRYDWLVCM